MSIVVYIDNQEFKISQGDWITTDMNQYGQVMLDNDSDYFIIKDLNGKLMEVDLNVAHVTSIGKTHSEDSLVKFLDENSEPAMKELVKDGMIKPKMSLIPQLAQVEVAKVFTYGAEKYAEYNFSKGARNTTYCDAALRHINKYLRGQDLDDESNLNHLAHAISCLMMLLDNDLVGTSIENRNKVYE